jgi:ribonuclease HI
MAEVQIDTHFPGSLTFKLPDININDAIAPHHTWITLESCKAAINVFKNDKAAGPDQIKPIVLKHLPDNVLLRLVTLFSASIETGYTPEVWRHSRAILIPKPGKDDYTNPNSFRPISLTSFMFKTLERLVLWRLEDTALKQHPMHKNQHAFRRGHSTEIPLSELTHYVEQAFVNKEYVISVFLDIIGAFNNVSHEAIVTSMKKHNFPDDILEWYSNYTCNRTVEFNAGNKIFTRYLIDGFAQGGILSPPIFNLTVNDILIILERLKTLAAAFADDIHATEKGKHLVAIINKLQRALDEICAYLDSTGMKFSTDKTQAMIFSRKNISMTDIPKLKLYNTEIEYVQEFKYLGVVFDTKLTFQRHIAQKFTKTKRILFNANNAIGKFWGPKPIITKWLYTNIVRPTLTYGCIAWAKATRTKTFKNKAKRLQRLGLKNIAPIREHTPTSGLEIITHTIPLELYIKGELMSAFSRIQPYIDPNDYIHNQNTIASHLAWAHKLLDDAGIGSIPKDTIIPHFQWKKNWTCTLDCYNDIQEARPHKLHIYTDGSRIKNGQNQGTTGSGHVFIQFDYASKDYRPTHIGGVYLGSYASVFQAEMEAIYAAARTVNENAITYRVQGITDIDIITDSRSSLQALSRPITTSSLVRLCKNELDSLSDLFRVNLHWIKAHQGHAGNELADQTAKEATKRPDQSVEPIIPVPKSWIQKQIKRYLHNEWSDQWNRLNEARQTKIFFPTPHKRKSNDMLRYSRDTYGKLIRWITGHSFHRYHNSITTPEEFPDYTCRACGIDREENNHLIMTCPVFMNARHKIFGQHILNQNFDWQPTELLEMIDYIERTVPEEPPADYGLP